MESEKSTIYVGDEESDSSNRTSSVKAISNMTLEEHKYFMAVDLEERSTKSLLKGEDTSPPDEVTSWQELCRICANGNDYLIPIFEGEGLQNQFCNKINKYLPIQVAETDDLPLQLCYQCAATLLAWHKLADECIAAEHKLRELQNTLHIKEQDVRNQSPSDSRTLVNDSTSVIPADQERIEDTSCNSTVNDPSRSGYTRTSFKLLLDTLNSFWRPYKKRHVECKSKPVLHCGESNPHWITVTNSTSHEVDGSESESDTSRQDENEEKTKVENESDNVVEAIQSNSSKRMKTCPICKDQKNSEDMCEHMKMIAKESYQCAECRKCFKLKDSYIRHMRIHTDERPFTCHICGKQFRVSGGLSRHLKEVHAKVKKFMCDICGRCFASKATKEDHRRTHTGERPYVCDSCGKSFKSKACLYTHCKLHTDEYPHPCTQCNKKFRRRQEMLAHLTTHTGEKNYGCDVCSKRFRVKSELVRHKLVHSESKPFICIKCGLAFRQKRYLNNHIKSRHIENSRKC